MCILFYLEEWAGDIKDDGQLVEITVTGNIETEITKNHGSHSLGQRLYISEN